MNDGYWLNTLGSLEPQKVGKNARI